MYSSCLVASKFILRKINSSVCFVQTFLQKMLYIAKPPNFPYTFSAVNMWIMNQFHTYSQKKQNLAKKFIKSGQIEIAQWNRRWDRVVEARSKARSSGAVLWSKSGAVLQSTIGAMLLSMIGAVRSSDWSSVYGHQTGARGSPAKSLLPLSLRSGLSLSLSLSLSFRKCFEVKIGTENNFQGPSLIFTINWK